MTNLTHILANESGIQYQGVDDASSSTGAYPIIGQIVGTFKRGRYDKPMVITNSNINSCLGYDPENPSYIAVKDALNSGVPSVQVLRLVELNQDDGGDGGGTVTATNSVSFAIGNPTYNWNVKVNNVVAFNGSSAWVGIMSILSNTHLLDTRYMMDESSVTIINKNSFDVVLEISIVGEFNDAYHFSDIQDNQTAVRTNSSFKVTLKGKV